MLDEGVVAEPQDVDLCMLLGAGWPFHLGGILPVPGPHRRLRAGRPAGASCRPAWLGIA